MWISAENLYCLQSLRLFGFLLMADLFNNDQAANTNNSISLFLFYFLQKTNMSKLWKKENYPYFLIFLSLLNKGTV